MLTLLAEHVQRSLSYYCMPLVPRPRRSTRGAIVGHNSDPLYGVAVARRSCGSPSRRMGHHLHEA
jgi:hypothetical protein